VLWNLQSQLKQLKQDPTHLTEPKQTHTKTAPRPKPKGKCYRCGKEGHYIRECRQVHNKKKRNNPDRNYRKRFNRKQRKKALDQQAQEQAELVEKYKTLEAEQQALTKVMIKLCTKLGHQGDELYACIEEHAYVMGEQKLPLAQVSLLVIVEHQLTWAMKMKECMISRRSMTLLLWEMAKC